MNDSGPGCGQLGEIFNSATQPGNLSGVKLNDLKRNWNDLGKVDPLWAILGAPDSKGNRWSVDEFFKTGVAEVDEYFAVLDRLDLRLPANSRVLDFGCGAGRLTQALAQRFDRAEGVDIAESMIALADAHNVDASNTTFRVNELADLSIFPDGSFDFLMSIVVLQHMKNSLKESYLREFFRVLRPGGIAMFTVPSHAGLSLNGMARRLPNSVQNIYRRRRYGYNSVMEFYTMRRKLVEASVARSGCALKAVLDDPMAGPPWHSCLYVVQKPTQ